MASYGGYETVRELYRSGLASSFSARKAGETAERHTVKLYQPLVADAMADRLRAEIDCFLDGARIQQKVASSGARNWSAVHEIGAVEGGAFYVGDYHGRSVQQLVTGRVKLSGAGLYQLIHAIVQGLSELKKACNRPHGNLKPTNILLAGKGRISKARPLLADPAGAARLDPQMGDVVDFHALGEIIYQLVLHRTGKAMGGWPAPAGPEWDRLGKKGEQWRQLCNRLLNPNLAPNLLTFDDLLEDLQKLRQTEGIPWLIVGPAAAAVLLAAGAAVLFWPAAPPPPWGPKEATQWQIVCMEFGYWVGPLLSDREGRRLASWQEDPFLKANVLPALDEDGAVRNANPGLIAGQTWGDVFKLGDNPPDRAKSHKAIKQTEAAAAIYQTMRGYLVSDEWPAYARVCNSAKAFAARDWKEQARYLESLQAVGVSDLDASEEAVLKVAALKDSDPVAIERGLLKIQEILKNIEVVAHVQAILNVQADLKKIDTLCAQVDKLVLAAQSWQAGGLKGLDEYAAGKLRAPPARSGPDGIADLANRLGDLQDANGPLSGLVQYIQSDQVKRLDMGYVRQSPPFAVPDGGQFTEEILRRGLAELRSGKYDLKQDPRSLAWKAKENDRLAGRNGDLKAIASDIADLLMVSIPPDAEKALQDARSEMDSLAKNAGQIDALYIKTNEFKFYDFETRQTIDKNIEAISSGLANLGRDCAALRKKVKDISDRLVVSLKDYKEKTRLRKWISPKDLPAISSAWEKQRNVLLDGNDTNLGSLRAKVDRLEKFLHGLEDAFGQGLSPKPEQRQWNGTLLTDGLDTLRRSAIESSLSYVDWPKVFAAQSDEGFNARKDQLVANYDKWRADLAAVVPAVNRIQDLLGEGYMLDEKPADGQATIAETYQPVKDSVVRVLADPVASQSAGPILARMTALGRIGQLTGAGELLATAASGKSGSFEAARAAWQRLGKLAPAWPAGPDDLKQEIEVRKNLDTLYGLLAGDARKGVLKAELAVESRRRWQEYFLTRGDPRQIEDAIARMGDFGVSPSDASLRPLAKYRLAMWDFRQEMIAGKRDLDDETVKGEIAKFLDKVKAMPAEVNQRPELAALVGKLDELLKAKNAAIDLTKAGPGAAGWAMTEQTAGTVTYTWTGRDQKLTFARVAPKIGEPCFLCTTEVSTGLFINVVMGLGKWSQMQQALPAEEDTRGPRSWIRGGGGIQIDPNWFPVIPPVLVGKLYAPGLKVDVPGSPHPVQQVPAAAAVYFARLLNCRLPTSTEWQAAYEQDKASASRKAYNLRDKTWLAQKAHDIALENSGDLPDPEQFYPDAGVYWPASIPAAQRKLGRDSEAWPNLADDGVLWFAKVVDDNQRVFQHLVGNVAEYVYEDPKALADLKAPTIAQVKQLLQAGGNAKVIGGSAMSPPQVPVDQPQARATPDGNECYSDVGLRLAFLAGRERIQTTLQKRLGDMPDGGYLPPAKP